MDLVGKWAIVTGASSGIGAAYARALARAGYAVLAVARRKERLEALAAEMKAEGAHVEPFPADLEMPSGVSSVVRRARELEGVGILVNSAGFAEYGEFVTLAPERSTSQIQLNILALVELTRGVLPLMVDRGRGAVVNVASGMAFQPVPYFAVYGATKAFVLSFTDALARELQGTGVQVQALCPGVTRTEFGSVANVEAVLKQFPASSAEEVVRASMRGLGRRRIVTTVGAFTRLMAFLARITPRSWNRALGGRLMRPTALLQQ